MRTILSPSSDPAFNLAAEEVFLSSPAEDCGGDLLLLWASRPSVIVGKFQNPYAEVSLSACEARGIPVVRRNSGGGTVYHDPGNLNYTVITDRGAEFPDFGRFLSPLIRLLAERGIRAEIRDTSALFAEGKKFSGSAQSCVRIPGTGKERQMHHGTLLFSSDLEALAALTGKSRAESEGALRYSSRAVGSSPSPVGNLAPLFEKAGSPMNFADFRSLVAREYPRLWDADPDPSEPSGFTEEETGKIESLAREKYARWDWNFGRTPAFAFASPRLSLTAKNGVILTVSTDLCDPEKLVGARLDPEEIKRISREAAETIFE